ncbi:VanW family protein [Sporanaerobacter sp. PP17-6a]|jgi:vancomycin resistance protein YoaR|uniref:VanW family protein n=1 Tax=Sporanaerobacter sp. PP17-6a TaxID=1891289 RepID=UPI0008A042E7|nr:VanW family protein [Sporanaerobacter sp. PP17-6a]SCL89077.1 Vancomycin B-type resistance protein VanW [Sporanaerobacter sp. PP17-6a]
MEKTKIKNMLLIILGIIVIIFGIEFFVLYSKLNTKTIYEGVKINNYDVGNMNEEQALKFLQDKLEKQIEEKNMTLRYENKTYKIMLKDLEFNYDYKKGVEEGHNIGRSGSVLKRIRDIYDTKKHGAEIELQWTYNPQKIKKTVEGIAQAIDMEGKDADISFNGKNFSITEETTGRKVNTEKLIKDIENNMNDLKEITIDVEQSVPTKTKALLSRINGVIGEFSTSFKGSSRDRIENITISAKSINNKVIMPKESVSFNNITGPRDKKFGYKEANVIVSGEFTPGVGGGVCQMSTTLYNALVRADINIMERHHHSIPATYVNYGHDAAVSYGYLDLKFQNEFDFPIYIYTRVSGSRVYVYIYGDRNVKDYDIDLVSDPVEKVQAQEETVVDTSLKPGTKQLVQKGRNGYKVKTYKVVSKNGEVTKKELITSDFYTPKNYIYKVNPQKEDASKTFTEEESLDSSHIEEEIPRDQ